MERKEPIAIKYAGFSTKYYCRKCLKRVYKKNRFCPHCFNKNGEIIKIDWETNKK